MTKGIGVTQKKIVKAKPLVILVFKPWFSLVLPKLTLLQPQRRVGQGLQTTFIRRIKQLRTRTIL
jgi:hypothetical protein